MNFNEALEAIKEHNIVTRKKWQNKARVYLIENKMNHISHIEVRTVNHCIMYAASSEDLLANDWELLEKEIKDKPINYDEIVL